MIIKALGLKAELLIKHGRTKVYSKRIIFKSICVILWLHFFRASEKRDAPRIQP